MRKTRIALFLSTLALATAAAASPAASTASKAERLADPLLCYFAQQGSDGDAAIAREVLMRRGTVCSAELTAEGVELAARAGRQVELNRMTMASRSLKPRDRPSCTRMVSGATTCEVNLNLASLR